MQRIVFWMWILVISRTSAQQMKCVSESKYYIPNFTANWFKATEYCKYLGMRLAEITTSEEQAKLAFFIQASDKYNATATQIWIGGNDLAEEGNFYWHDTGLGLGYTFWGEGNPDNSGDDENCVEIRYVPPGWAWHWNDRTCYAERFFACENTEQGRGILIL
ncbi:C-type lectin 37Db-like [Toxorhynchites rutilus septentrionalis]|uniref:C-type lectin 37Db-like n=1 Tax=Toxorhynchites rutilus septentrionalis TaxID=329112 RepID=UPI002479BE38|nr:C-type lectin 37Db-like [Toxorhynchites rutilus septentrionalis]